MAFLADNPTLAEAWAGVHGIAPDDIEAFVATLTPVQLLSDTRVTNHGFADGRATPRQSVLQAGTAVLVDEFGIPRARCACGYPPLEPQAAETTPTYTGNRWTGFTPTRVAATSSRTEIDVIVLVDIDTNVTFVRPVGTSGEEDAEDPDAANRPGAGEGDPSGTFGLAMSSSGPTAGQNDLTVDVQLGWTGGVTVDEAGAASGLGTGTIELNGPCVNTATGESIGSQSLSASFDVSISGRREGVELVLDYERSSPTQGSQETPRAVPTRRTSPSWWKASTARRWPSSGDHRLRGSRGQPGDARRRLSPARPDPASTVTGPGA